MSSSNLASIDEYPDVSFIDNLTMQTLEDNMVKWFMDKRKELTGKSITLGEADDRRLMLKAGAYYIYQAFMCTDNAGKMGLLKYATGSYLDNLGALKGISRLNAAGATTTLRYSLGVARESATGIPAGSRATSGDGVYFATDEYVEIPAGSLYVDVQATCETPGTSGNVYGVGEISKMVVGIPFIDTVTNITKTENGRDIETDDELRERIYLAPESYTSAGSKGAYEYYVREYDPTIEDVYITSPSARVVEIRCILADGAIPETEYINGLTDYLNQDDVKMLTDQVVVEAPETVSYNLNFTYYINQSDRARAETIQTAVNKAVDAYKKWQCTKIGRDINPDYLVQLVKEAGAKRVVITSPSFTIIPVDSVAAINSQTVTYGGLEND